MSGNDIVIHKSAGGVVVSTSPGGVAVLLLHRRRYGKDEWVLPKGHIEPGETPEQAAAREVAEEAGLSDAAVVRRLGVYRYSFRLPDDPREHHKTVSMFLMRSPNGEVPLYPKEDEGIYEARWLQPEEAVALATHPNEAALIRKGVRAALRGLGRGFAGGGEGL